MHSWWRFSVGHVSSFGKVQAVPSFSAFSWFRFDWLSFGQSANAASILWHPSTTLIPYFIFSRTKPHENILAICYKPRNILNWILIWKAANILIIITVHWWRMTMMTRAKWIGVTNGCLTTSFRLFHDFLCICTMYIIVCIACAT